MIGDSNASVLQQKTDNIVRAANKILKERGIFSDLIPLRSGLRGIRYEDEYILIQREDSLRLRSTSITIYLMMEPPVKVFHSTRATSVTRKRSGHHCTLLRNGEWLTYLRDMYAEIEEDERIEAEAARETRNDKQFLPVDDAAFFSGGQE